MPDSREDWRDSSIRRALAMSSVDRRDGSECRRASVISSVVPKFRVLELSRLLKLRTRASERIGCRKTLWRGAGGTRVARDSSRGGVRGHLDSSHVNPARISVQRYRPPRSGPSRKHFYSSIVRPINEHPLHAQLTSRALTRRQNGAASRVFAARLDHEPARDGITGRIDLDLQWV